MTTHHVHRNDDAPPIWEDPGFVRGLAVFETLRTYGTHLFRLEAHLDRLADSGRSMGIVLPDRATMRTEIVDGAAADSQVRYVVTGGGNRVVSVSPLDFERLARPVRLGRMTWQPPDELPGLVKHTNRAAWMIACRDRDVDEVLLVDNDGYVLESNRANVIAVVDGHLVTPALDGRFLSGVTRGAMLEAAQAAGMPFTERPLHIDEPWTELYLSSTLKELVAAASIDGLDCPPAGPIGGQLRVAFDALVQREVEAQSAR
jgi:branched-chain amino acid aminotransferase